MASFWLAFIFLAFQIFDKSRGEVFSIRIDEYDRACFGYDLTERAGEVFVHMQVIKGGNTDIDYQVFDPNGNKMISEERVSNANFDFNVTVEGTYKVCLDNSFTKEYKVVMLGMEHDAEDEMQALLSKISLKDENVPPGFKGKLELLMKNSDKLMQFHEIHAAQQKRHFFLVSNNLSRVNGFSVLSCFIMIGVGILQVFVVKGLFQDGGKNPFKFW